METPKSMANTAAVSVASPSVSNLSIARPSIEIESHSISTPTSANLSPITSRIGHSSAVDAGRTDEAVNAPEGRRWNSAWLSKPLIIALLFIAILLSASLIFLWHWSAHNSGFPVLVNASEVWTLTPTAVFVVLVGIWRQTDFYCKALQPWAELLEGDAAPSAILRDYVSPAQPFALYTAIKSF
jgi:hypothetical protein